MPAEQSIPSDPELEKNICSSHPCSDTQNRLEPPDTAENRHVVQDLFSCNICFDVSIVSGTYSAH